MLLALLTPQISAIAATETSPEWIYSVRPQDTLIHFGKRHLINPDDWRILQKLNHIKDPYRMPVGSKIRVPLSLVKQGPASAEVILTSGVVYILSVDKSKKLVIVGQQLNVGDELQTADKSKLNIRFADGSIVTMQPNSTLKLDTLSMYSGGGMVDTKLRLQQGEVDVEANPKKVRGNQMKIFTPTAVAAVRGTEFRVSTDAHSVRQETLDGQVALSAAGEEVAVKKGYGSLSENGQAPQPPVMLLPAPDTKSLPVKLTALPITFTMPAQKDATAWIGKIYKEAQFNTVLAENESQTSHLDFGDLDDGQYYLQVRAKDNKGFEGYDATHVFNLKARPFAPQPVSPRQAEVVTDSKPTFSWSAVNMAKTYLVELAKDAQFSHLLQTEQVVTNQFIPANVLQTGEYFWRLASVNGDDIGPYSSVNHFKYKPKPPAPDISQLVAKVENNRAYITTIDPPQGFVYEAMVDNEKNHQMNVWRAVGLSGKFDFLLREYGKQTLRLRLIDSDGLAGLEAKTEFDANSQW
ncbi:MULTISPECIES: FecR domain-containing protein [Methylotenera]|uniref:FecR domain-containing protein n=1 Tax=Methylotenera TaxID=359407 RepID=UPI0003658B88|nr:MULTISPECIES: FecR domain-containing protein [Methylotenera]